MPGVGRTNAAGQRLDPLALSQAWPKYDAMRTELAVGQFADLVNDAGGFPTWDQVLAVSRRKSGNYTVRRPLEIGATLAGCSQHVLTLLGGYGEAIGVAFQLRDDLLGIFGSPSVTGKPAGNDLRERKATSVVVAAHHLADPLAAVSARRAYERKRPQRQRHPALENINRCDGRSGLDRTIDRLTDQTGVELG